MTISDISSPDAPTTTNKEGGSQSHIPVRFDLIDAKALFAMAAVLHTGAEKYGVDNWRKIPVEDHLNHLIMHTYAYLAGDQTDEHLSHIMCRATFAQAVHITDNSPVYISSPDLREYLDMGITNWRDKKDKASSINERGMCSHYIDAFQSVRVSMFGEELD